MIVVFRPFDSMQHSMPSDFLILRREGGDKDMYHDYDALNDVSDMI
jgi:hypothetical protein